MANFSQSASFSGIGTYTMTIPTTDTYNFQATLTLPNSDATASQGAGGGAGTGSAGNSRIVSQVVLTINKNGSPVLASAAGDRGISVNALACTVGDVMTFVTSSAQASDKASNSVRVTLAISEGPL